MLENDLLRVQFTKEYEVFNFFYQVREAFLMSESNRAFNP